MRMFVAIALPETIRAACERLQQGVPGARWVPPENMHLTLRFLGEVGGGDFDDLMHALADVVVPPFEIEVAGVGHFETRQVPTTLWAGIKPSPELKHLQAKVERAVRSIGLPPETRKFVPHITLARLGESDPIRIRIEILAGPSCTTEELLADPGDVLELQIDQNFLHSRQCR